MAGSGHGRIWICARPRCLRAVAKARHRELQGAAKEIGGFEASVGGSKREKTMKQSSAQH
jgi:hypothetical protein